MAVPIVIESIFKLLGIWEWAVLILKNYLDAGNASHFGELGWNTLGIPFN